MDISFNSFRDSDDALHPDENQEYYEWWYFDARMDNGYSCVATFHWLNAFIKPHLPSIQLFIYTPEGKKHVGMAMVNKSECQASLTKCDVKMADNYARQDDNSYKIYMRTKNLGAELTYHRRIPGWKQSGTGYLYDDGLKKQGWVIAAPRSDVEGTLYINGESIPVKGHGYHDKNWGNSNIYDCFSGWYWGRLYDPEFTLIYYWLFPVDQPGKVISRLLLTRKDQPILVTSDYEFSVDQSEPCSQYEKQLPKKISLRNKAAAKVQFNCELTTTAIVERDRLPKICEWDQYHWRFLGQHNIRVTFEGKTYQSAGKAIHEHLLFR